MREFEPIQRLKELIHYKRNLKAIPDGNSLCYKGEIGGHFQIDQTPQDQEIALFPQAKSFSVPSGVIFEDPEVKAMMETNKKPIS